MKTSNSKLPKIKRESLGQPGLHCCSPREVPDQWHQHHQGLVRSRNSWAQATLAESDSLMWGPEVWVLTNAPSDSDDMKSWELLVWRKVHTPWSDNTLGFNPSSDTYAYSIFSFTELFSVLALSSIHQRQYRLRWCSCRDNGVKISQNAWIAPKSSKLAVPQSQMMKREKNFKLRAEDALSAESDMWLHMCSEKESSSR